MTSGRSNDRAGPEPRVRRRVLMLVENLSVPADRRVWQEAVSLHNAGYAVTVISPQGHERDTAAYDLLEGIEIHRYRPSPASGGAGSYLREYASAAWRITRLVRSLAADRGFDVVHAANPPDVLLLTALPLRRRGARFVYDQHDLVPELVRIRFGARGAALVRVATAFERLSFRLADVVIAPNDSFRHIAITRGNKDPRSVYVVRNAPDPRRFRARTADERLKRGKAHLIAYVGMMAPQDGVDYALRALAILRAHRSDWRAMFVGGGESLADLRRLAGDLGLADFIEFTGLMGDEEITRILSSADVCLAPEPRNLLNDASTMIKIAEYMAIGRPVVSFDLRESRVTAGPAAVYAVPNDEESFAASIDELLSDPKRRAEMGQLGRKRVEQELSWSHSESVLLAAYDYCVRRPDR
jgi:glycosyltransferase involved in cell wall biosynthesis